MLYRLSGYTKDGHYTGPIEVETNDLQDVLTNPHKHPIGEIETPVYVEVWKEGEWVAGD